MLAEDSGRYLGTEVPPRSPQRQQGMPSPPLLAPDTLSRIAAGLGLRFGLTLQSERETNREQGAKKEAPASPPAPQGALEATGTAIE